MKYLTFILFWFDFAIKYILNTSTVGYTNSRNMHSKFVGALSGLRQLLATESPLKMMKNTFYSILKALFVLKIFKFLS